MSSNSLQQPRVQCHVYPFPDYLSQGNSVSASNHCVVSANFNEQADSFLLLQSDNAVGSKCEFVLLPVCVSEALDSEDILLPRWIFGTILRSVNEGDLINISFVESTAIQPQYGGVNQAAVSFQFIAHYPIKHWDDHSLNFVRGYDCSGAIPCWCSYWPQGLSKLQIEECCSYLLYRCWISHGGLIVIPVLDMLLLMRVHIIDMKNDTPLKQMEMIQCNAHQLYNIVTTPNVTSSFNDGIISTTGIDHDKNSCSISRKFHSTVFQQLRMLVNVILRGKEGHRAMPRCILISAPVGSGKTTLLKHLQRRESGSSRVIYVSCKMLVPHDDHPIYTSTVEMIPNSQDLSSSEKKLEDVVNHMLNILLDNHSRVMYSSRDPLLILLDDIDCSNHLSHGLGPSNSLQLLLKSSIEQLSYTDCAAPICIIASSSEGTATADIPMSSILFEKVINLPSPKENERYHLLKMLLLQNIPENTHLKSKEHLQHSNDLQSEVDFQTTIEEWARDIAAISAGYLPGDLKALVQRIVMMESVGNEGKKYISWRTALHAFLSVKPKQLQQLGGDAQSSLQRSTIRYDSDQKYDDEEHLLSWKDFAGYQKIKDYLFQRVLQRGPSLQQQYNGLAHYQQSSINHTSSRGSSLRPKGILLYGPSGCGKSLLAQILAAEGRMNFVSVRCSELLSRYYGQTEANIRLLFRRARAAVPCLLFFDEFDALARKREGIQQQGAATETGGIYTRILSTFLNELDGITDSSPEGSSTDASELLVVAACGSKETLDEALLRPGRLHYHILLDKPAREDISDILQYYLNNTLTASTAMQSQHEEVLHAEHLEEIVSVLHTLHVSCVDVKALVRTATMAAVRQCIETQRKDSDAVTCCVSRTHFAEALTVLAAQYGFTDIKEITRTY